MYVLYEKSGAYYSQNASRTKSSKSLILQILAKTSLTLCLCKNLSKSPLFSQLGVFTAPEP